MAAQEWGWRDLEQLLQCPVCLELPPGEVEQCNRGHHFCSGCRSQLDVCPMCKSRFYGTRNFLTEELINNIEIIKNYMTLVNIQTSSDSSGLSSSVENTNDEWKLPKNRPLLTPTQARGLYPCRADDNCHTELGLCRLPQHVRYYHGSTLHEAIVSSDDTFCQIWELEYRPVYGVTRHKNSLQVTGMGLFFFTIEILSQGGVLAYLQLAGPKTVAIRFEFTVKLTAGGSVVSYTGLATSCRMPYEIILQSHMCLAIQKRHMKRLFKNQPDNRLFQCQLNLRYSNNTVPDNNHSAIEQLKGERIRALIEESKKTRRSANSQSSGNAGRNPQAGRSNATSNNGTIVRPRRKARVRGVHREQNHNWSAQ